MHGLRLIEGERLRSRIRTLRSFAETCAIATIAVAALALFAGVSGITSIATAAPWVLEMEANTTLGVIAAGASLLLALRDRRRAVAALALVPLLIGVATAVEHLFKAGPVIDQIVFSDWSSGEGAYPGRPPLNTAIALILLGASLLATGLLSASLTRNVAIRILAFAVTAIAMETLAGHILDSPYAIGWGSGEQMAVLTAICLFAIGAGLIAHSWEAEVTAITRLPPLIPALLCFALVLFDLYASRDIDSGVGYTLLVLCALWFERAEAALIFATIATLLAAVGLFASPAGELPFAIAATNRIFAVMTVWIVGLLIYLHHKSGRRLRRSERHLASAQRVASHGSFELEFAGMTFNGSQAFVAIHGLSDDEAHDWEAFLRRSVPADERAAIEQMIETMRQGGEAEDVEYAFLDATATPRNGVMHCELLRDAIGTPVGVLGVVHDVTALRQAEAARSDIEFQLQHAQKLEALGMLAGGIAHDINNTLVPVTTLTPLLRETVDDPQDREILDIIMDSARRAKELVREMLVFSRKEPAEFEPIRLDLIARDALTLIRAGIPASIDIVDELKQVPEIVGSRGQIYQMLLNLATNAAQAIGDHAGRIRIGSDSDMNAASGRRDVRLYIADDGSGMDEETRSRIFEPFFSTKEARGTGLGLAIVNGIVQSHGGSIRVESAPGAGTRFDLVFPAIDAKVAT